jgi:diguanylate cyclase (GGDEF)-like protein/PAS domain S-box-containing protein
MQNKHDVGLFSVAPSSAPGLPELQAAALEATANAVVITDQTGTVIWVNSAFEKLTGYIAASIVGQSTCVLKSGQNSQSLYEDMWQTILGGRVWRGELINRRKDGSLYDEEMTITPLLNRTGVITHYVAIKLDISDRKRSDVQRYMLAQAIENSSELMATTDPESRITFANRALIHALGYSEEKELIGKNIATTMSPNNDPELFSEIFKSTMEGGGWRGECLYLRADGTDYPISLSTNIVKDPAGRIIGTLGIAQDITERKRAEKELKNSESKHRALFEDSADAHLLTDDKGFVACNSALLQMFGYSSKAEIMALHPADLSPPNQPDGTPSRALANQQVAIAYLKGSNRFEWLHRRKDGRAFPAEVSLTALTLNGRPALLGTVLDISERKKMEGRFRQLANIVECSDDAIISKSLDGTIQTWNLGAERLYEYSAAEAIGKPISIIFLDGQQDESSAILGKIKQDETVKHFETIRKTQGGKQIHIDLTVSPTKDATGRITGASTIARDITERVRTDERLRLWSQVLDQSGEGIFICDSQERILIVNKAFQELTGFSSDDALGKTPRILRSGRQDRTFYTDMWKSVSETGAWRGEMWNRRKSGELYAEWLSISAIYGHKGEVTHYIGIFSDITARKQDAEKMSHLAHYDALTDLPNRVLLMDRLNQLTKGAERRKSKVALVFIDLDRFKDVNDSLGHQAGDLLLQTVAKRFSSVMRAEDTLARIGGDEFVAIFQGIHDGQDASIIAKELFTCVAEPVALSGHEVTVTASMGISVYPDDATDGQEMIRNADAAMYQAKGAGRNAYQFYTSDLNQRALEMLSMESGLRRAIERQEFVLYYQPQVDIASGSVVGAEALIRWNHPELGLVMPGKFISIAEERGLIVPIGNWTIDEAARQAAIWQNEGTPIRIAVNVSAVQFRQKDFVEQLANKIQKYGIAPAQLELELTERIIMRDAKTTIDILEKLHKMGVQLSIDDFGTGYSSLNYLRQFPIDKIKIDQSFVKDENAGHIVKAVIGLARGFNLKVIAEGVETKEQLELLRERGCDEVQGFLFSPALPPDEFEKLARDWKLSISTISDPATSIT